MRSILIGTAGLGVALVAATFLAINRRPTAPEASRVAPWFVGAIAAQFAHFAEEYIGGFHIRFPELLGLAPWSARFFVNFNLACVVVFLFSVPLVRRGFRPAFLPVWFLSLAAMANGIAHPLLALSAGGYFPGLWTSPLLGGLGLLLWLRLWRATSATAV